VCGTPDSAAGIRDLSATGGSAFRRGEPMCSPLIIIRADTLVCPYTDKGLKPLVRGLERVLQATHLIMVVPTTMG
jgi:hypothetical protein